MAELSNLTLEPQLETPSPGAILRLFLMLLFYRKQGSHHAFITTRCFAEWNRRDAGEDDLRWWPLEGHQHGDQTAWVLPTGSRLRSKWSFTEERKVINTNKNSERKKLREISKEIKSRTWCPYTSIQRRENYCLAEPWNKISLESPRKVVCLLQA